MIVDPYRYWKPEIENPKLADAELRKIHGAARTHKTSIFGVCHPRRMSNDARQNVAVNLEDDPRGWIQTKSRGSGNLISNSDVRLGFNSLANEDGRDRLVLAGFRRVQGSIGPMRIEKVLHPEDGEPWGFRRVVIALSAEHERLLTELPTSFRFTDAAKVYGKKSARAVDAFLKACQQAGRLRKEKRRYVKIGE